MHINIIFHHIVEKEMEIDNPYTITFEKYSSIVNALETQALALQFRYYFDDGYSSFYNKVYKRIDEPVRKKTTLAIITKRVGTTRYLSQKELEEISQSSIKIASHGVSHSALAVYRNNRLMETPLDGPYRDTPMGQGNHLSENEVLFQLIESKKFLEDKLGVSINEFVFPYGLYNAQVLRLNRQHKVYQYMSTCNEEIDRGTALRPRILVEQRSSADTFVDKILNIVRNG